MTLPRAAQRRSIALASLSDVALQVTDHVPGRLIAQDSDHGLCFLDVVVANVGDAGLDGSLDFGHRAHLGGCYHGHVWRNGF